MLIKRQHPNIVRAYDSISLAGFPHGLNSALPITQILKTECSSLVNFIILKGGSLASRDGISRYTTTATTSSSAVVSHCKVNIGSTPYVLLQDANHVVYYLDSDPKPVTIGTLAARASIIGYNGVAVLLDGDYVKYIDSVSGIKIAYDDGDGTAGYQFDNTSATSGTSLALGNGTNVRVATKFTSQSWTAGYTIPPTTVSAYLYKTGSPTGSITCKLRKVSDDSELASKTFLSDVTTLTSVSTLFTMTFSSSDITTEMSPSVEYYASLEYSSGDASNYVNVDCESLASGGTSYYYTTSWSNDATKSLLMSLKPGRPPKGKFGDVKYSRLFIGGDPDNPGYVWYCNLTHLDWSSSGGGGYIGVVDGHKDNYEVAAIATIYGDLIVYGTEAQPYLSKLTGTSPSDYALPATFQKPWTTHRTLVSSMNDLWAASRDGVDPLSGVQEYGDLRTFSASDPVFDRITNYWDSDTAFAGYYPKEGQYWLIMPTYHRVLAAHTKIPVREPVGGTLRYPWTELEFYRDILTSDSYQWTASANGTNEYYLEKSGGGDPSITTKPDFLTLDGTKIAEGTAGSLEDHTWDYADNDSLGFDTVYLADATGDPDSTGVEVRSVLLPTSVGQAGSIFLIGGSDGYLYEMSKSSTNDLTSIQTKGIVGTACIEVPFNEANFNKFQPLCTSEFGGQFDACFYINGTEITGDAVLTMAISLTSDLLVGDATMLVDDAFFTMTSTENKELFENINFNAASIMVVMNNFSLAGSKIYITGILLRYRRLSH